ncbi:hypothetical protein pipiens_019895 [Culex pipiens pipiens]|uniref:40S ribosomal protein S2 n=1 Tax=Culex pipiens pipiens TaxID=38569 RepID=A0ABD1DQS9_CULPP
MFAAHFFAQSAAANANQAGSPGARWQDPHSGGDLPVLAPDPEAARSRTNVLKIMPVQKQTRAGQRTRFKAFVAIGDSNGHICLGVKCSKEVATAIRGAIILAKLSVVPVRRGYWGNKIGKPHTVPCKVFGKCGSILVRLNPALRGTALCRPRSRRSCSR